MENIEVFSKYYRKFFLFSFMNYANYKDYKLDGNRGVQEKKLDEGKKFGETQVL